MSSLFEFPVSNTKVRVPFRRRELISRARLLDALYEQLEKRLLVIVAPAGYGKTSLLVDLAQQSEVPICWLALDTLDQEPQRFLRYLIASLAEGFPEFGRDSLAALESLTSFERDEERLLVTLSNEINAQIDEHFLLILDDYHLVGEVPIIAHMLGRLLQLTGENVHLVLSSRNLPDIPDAPLLIARNQVGGLTFEELAFLPEEIQQLFQQNNGLSLSRQDAQELVEQTEGWIAAIHLTNGQPLTMPRLHPLESTRELFDFFSSEVLKRQTAEVQRFLLMTSPFETFDVALCEQVLAPLVEGEPPDWAFLFETIRTGNLFSVPVDREGRWMRYHHLFQHFLRSQLQYEQPVLAWHIQQNLARAYESQQAWEEALELYARQDDHENQVRVLIRAGPVFIMSGRILTLANWLDKLPEAAVYSQPVLLSLLGIVYASKGENRRALELLDLAEAGLRNSGNEAEWTTTLVRRAEVRRQLGQFDLALLDVQTIFEHNRDSQMLDMQHTFVEAQRIRGLASYGLGHMQEALHWLEKSLQGCRRLGIQRNIPVLETELGVVHRRLGETEMAARYYGSALKAWENAGNTGWKARLLNNLGVLYHMTGRLDEAYAFLESALKTAERSGYVQIQTNVLISLGDVLSDLSDLDGSYDYFDQALTLGTNLGHSLYIFYASLGEAHLHRLQGEPLLAIEELKHAEVSQVSLGLFERAKFNLELGCAWLDANKPEPAVDVLRLAERLFGEGGNLMEQAVAGLWLESALSLHFPDTAIEKLKALMPPQRDWQKPTPLIIQAGQAGRWLRKRGSSQLFKDPIIRKFFEAAESVLASVPLLYNKIRQSALGSTSESARLEIATFGNVRVWNNQREINISDWQTREARDLFIFLLQSKPLTKEQIALEFWPDISPARLKVRFKINIYRLRKAVGQDAVVFENEKYHFNRDLNYRWDREEFDELFRKLQGAPVSDRLRLLKRATDMIRPSYLADLDAAWAVADRLHFQDLYRDLMVELATLYLQSDQPRECLEIARLALRSDPLLEAAHRLIIQSYATLHDPAGMTLQYRQYQQILMTELGLQPSSDMNRFFEQLLDAV